MKGKGGEAGRVFSGLKIGSSCHVVGTKASLGEYKDRTYYYTFLETKQVFCNKLYPNGTSDTVISRELSGDTDSRDVNSDSASCSWK